MAKHRAESAPASYAETTGRTANDVVLDIGTQITQMAEGGSTQRTLNHLKELRNEYAHRKGLSTEDDIVKSNGKYAAEESRDTSMDESPIFDQMLAEYGLDESLNGIASDSDTDAFAGETADRLLSDDDDTVFFGQTADTVTGGDDGAAFFSEAADRLLGDTSSRDAFHGETADRLLDTADDDAAFNGATADRLLGVDSDAAAFSGETADRLLAGTSDAEAFDGPLGDQLTGESADAAAFDGPLADKLLDATDDIDAFNGATADKLLGAAPSTAETDQPPASRWEKLVRKMGNGVIAATIKLTTFRDGTINKLQRYQPAHSAGAQAETLPPEEEKKHTRKKALALAAGGIALLAVGVIAQKHGWFDQFNSGSTPPPDVVPDVVVPKSPEGYELPAHDSHLLDATAPDNQLLGADQTEHLSGIEQYHDAFMIRNGGNGEEILTGLRQAELEVTTADWYRIAPDLLDKFPDYFYDHGTQCHPIDVRIDRPGLMPESIQRYILGRLH